ncbi:MAG: Holliday junction resolvase RuvX [Patescibacteria group bacterium]
MRVLGLDVGKKRIGVALGDTENKVVVGLSTLINGSGTFSELQEIVIRENIKKLIIGWPTTMSGQSGQQVDYTRKWSEQAIKVLNISVEYMDERLSSKMARDSLAAIGQQLTKENIDQAAAVLILQNYLERLKN